MGLFSDIYIFMKSLLDLKVQRGLFVAKLLHEIYATGIVCTNPSCYHRAGIAPPNTLVVSTFIVREFEQGSVSVGMAMAVLCVLFSTTALLILNTVIDHRKVH